ncbi:hypothetical protein Trydic_g2819 [Trypoxylus dichotomus]
MALNRDCRLLISSSESIDTMSPCKSKSVSLGRTMDTKRSIVWRYFVDCRKSGDNTVECKSCMKRYAYQGNTTNMFHHIKTYHPHLYNEIVTEQRRVSVLHTNTFLPSNKEEDDKNKKQTPIASQPETSEIDVKAEFVSDSYCDQSFIVESPTRSDDSLQEPSISATATAAAAPNVTGFDCSAPKRKRNEIDISRMISSISTDIRSLVDRSLNTSDTHFYQSVAFEVEKLDEDGKDLVKAAVWQIIYKVKLAKKRHVDLSLEDIFQ